MIQEQPDARPPPPSAVSNVCGTPVVPNNQGASRVVLDGAAFNRQEIISLAHNVMAVFLRNLHEAFNETIPVLSNQPAPGCLMTCPLTTRPLYSLHRECWTPTRSIVNVLDHLENHHLQEIPDTFATLDFGGSRSHQLLNGVLVNVNAAPSHDGSLLSEEIQRKTMFFEIDADDEEDWLRLHKVVVEPPAGEQISRWTANELMYMNTFIKFTSEKGRQRLNRMYAGLPIKAKAAFPNPEELFQMVSRLWLVQAVRRYGDPMVYKLVEQLKKYNDVMALVSGG